MKSKAITNVTPPIKDRLNTKEILTITIPKRFGFRNNDVMDFDSVLELFDWNIKNSQVNIDFRKCKSADYQAISLIVIYSWYLKSNGCNVEHIIHHNSSMHASAMWKKLGALGTFNVLNENKSQFIYKKYNHKPLFALRSNGNNEDFKKILHETVEYTNDFDISYIKTLRYILSELMYNTLEHGSVYSEKLKKHIPSLVQTNWYQRKEVMNFIIVDLGVGIKTHLEQAYSAIGSDEEAIKLAIQPEKSGTFNSSNAYSAKNNAGMGLFLSSNIIQKLQGDFYIISGNGQVHISPKDTTSKTLENSWKGTIAFLSIKIGKNTKADLDSMLQELRGEAETERNIRDNKDKEQVFELNMSDYFGDYAEIKSEAISFRDKYLLPNIAEGKKIIINCKNIKSAPHSFLNALLATPIKTLGLDAYKKIRVINATSNIRETIDFIFDDNT